MPASEWTETTQYQDFELTAVPARTAHSYLVTARSTAGHASGQTTLDPGGEEWRGALDVIEREETDEGVFLQLGTWLFEALFPGDVEDAYRASMGYAKGEGKGLRVRLRLTEVPALAALPWEYLYDRQRDIFLGVSSDTPLSRFIEPQQVFPPPPPPEGRLRLLTVISDPLGLEGYGLPPLDAEGELEILNEALKRLKDQDLLEEIEPLRHAVRADVSEALREHRPHALHFVGHGVFQGGQGKLIVEDEDHYALEMSDRAFRELLEGHAHTRLVVLNVCQGATRDAGDAMVGMGPQLVSRGVPAVVAMQYPVYDRAAVSFTREFYRALAHWYPIDVALSQARRAVYLDFGTHRRDWGVPVLFMRAEEGLLFRKPEGVGKPKPVGRTPGQPPRVEVSKSELRIAIAANFNLNELADLCVDIQDALAANGIELLVSLEMVGGAGLSGKARELIAYLDRRGYLDYLVDAVRRERPGII